MDKVVDIIIIIASALALIVPLCILFGMRVYEFIKELHTEYKLKHPQHKLPENEEELK